MNEINQDNQLPHTHGGKREGAGRPEGSKQHWLITEFMTTKDIEEIVNKAKEKALSGNTQMLKLLIEQAVGKAALQIDLSSLGESVNFTSPEVETALGKLLKKEEKPKTE